MPDPAPAVVGLDIAKNVFQVHGADATGRRVLRRRLRRGEVAAFFARLPPCLVGIEACPGAHHWARELQALGHEVRLIPPQYVKPFVKTNKTDAADAEAICEAVVRPTMRFVPVKTVEQQAATMLHRTRALLIRQRTQLINAVRGHLAEFGLVAPKGTRNLRELADLVRDTAASVLPDAARAMLVLLLEQIREAQVRVAHVERALEAWAARSDACRRLMAIPGVGTMSATALVVAMGDPSRFRSGRHFAAWLGLVPKQDFERGAGEDGRHQQARGRLPEDLARARRPLGHALAAPELGVARRADGAPADQRRRRGHRQQDGAHGLGAAGEGDDFRGRRGAGDGRRVEGAVRRPAEGVRGQNRR